MGPLDVLLRRFGAGTGFRRYFVNTSWLLAGRGAQLALGLVVGAWMTGYLGPDRYGVYAFALSVATLFAPLANLGLGQIIVRETVQGGAGEQRLLGTALGIRLAGTAVAFGAIAVLLLVAVPEPETRWAVALASGAIALRGLQILVWHFQAHVRAREAAVPQLASLVLTNALKAGLILGGAPMLAFVYVVLLDAALYSGLLWVAYARSGGRLAEWTWDGALARQLVRRSWPLMFTLVLYTVYLQMDQVMLKLLAEYRDVGWYGAAVRLSTASYVLPMVLTGSLFPAILSSRQGDPALFRRRMRALYRLLAVFALAVIGLAWVFREPVVRLVYGPAYAPSAAVLAVHVTASLFVYFGYAAEKWLIAEDRQRFTFYAVALGLALNVGLNVLLIPRYGIVGAAWATLAAQAVSYHLAFGLFRPTRAVLRLQTLALLDVLTLRPLWERRGHRRSHD